MNNKLIISSLSNLVKKENDVKGLILYGSEVDGAADQFSDYNFALKLNSNCDYRKFIRKFEILFAKTLNFKLDFYDKVGNFKVVFIIGNALSRIEFLFFSNFNEIAFILPSKSRIKIIYDPRSEIEEYLSNIDFSDNYLSFQTFDSVDSKKKFIKNQISNIINGFERLSSAHAHLDEFRFQYLHQNNIFLAIQILSVLKGKERFYHEPRMALRKMMEDTERQYFNYSMLQFNPTDLDESRRTFLDWFYDLLDKVIDVFSEDVLPLKLNKIEEICERIYNEYILFNFRVVYGTRSLYRTRQFSYFHENFSKLISWLKFKEIKVAIDLRRDDERVRFKSREDKFPDDSGINFKIITFDISELEKDIPPYLQLTLKCKNAVKEIFELIYETNGNILYHCQGGKDRTGVISAIIQKLVGVSNSRIVNDYLISGQDTEPERIQPVIDYLDEISVYRYLKSCGLSKPIIDGVKEKIKSNQI